MDQDKVTNNQTNQTTETTGLRELVLGTTLLSAGSYLVSNNLAGALEYRVDISPKPKLSGQDTAQNSLVAQTTVANTTLPHKKAEYHADLVSAGAITAIGGIIALGRYFGMGFADRTNIYERNNEDKRRELD